MGLTDLTNEETRALKGVAESWGIEASGFDIALIVRAALAAVPSLAGEREGLAALQSWVDAVADRYDDEGTLRHGELAIYRTHTGYAVLARRRNGSAMEFGRHGSLTDALLALSTAPAPPPLEEGTNDG